MNMYPSFTNLRSFVVYKFSSLRMRAMRDRLIAKLTRTGSALEAFPGKEAHLRLSPSRKLIGVKNIRVAQIVGTFNRDSDFDRHFRPLKRYTMNRWVNAYILREQDGWAPIFVHKVGEQYYVEDGHHRVSVARSTGMEFIEAKIWEYDIQGKATDACQSEQCAKRSPSKAYAAG